MKGRCTTAEPAAMMHRWTDPPHGAGLVLRRAFGDFDLYVVRVEEAAVAAHDINLRPLAMPARPPVSLPTTFFSLCARSLSMSTVGAAKVTPRSAHVLRLPSHAARAAAPLSDAGVEADTAERCITLDDHGLMGRGSAERKAAEAAGPAPSTSMSHSMSALLPWRWQPGSNWSGRRCGGILRVRLPTVPVRGSTCGSFHLDQHEPSLTRSPNQHFDDANSWWRVRPWYCLSDSSVTMASSTFDGVADLHEQQVDDGHIVEIADVRTWFLRLAHSWLIGLLKQSFDACRQLRNIDVEAGGQAPSMTRWSAVSDAAGSGAARKLCRPTPVSSPIC